MLFEHQDVEIARPRDPNPERPIVVLNRELAPSQERSGDASVLETEVALEQFTR
jgi:hypothetical protein